LREIANLISKYIFSINNQVDGLLFHLYNVTILCEICKICFADACCHNKLNQTSVACAGGPSVTTSSTDFSFINLVFWNLGKFSAAEST
jgi:hypothetical protein